MCYLIVLFPLSSCLSHSPTNPEPSTFIIGIQFFFSLLFTTVDMDFEIVDVIALICDLKKMYIRICGHAKPKRTNVTHYVYNLFTIGDLFADDILFVNSTKFHSKFDQRISLINRNFSVRKQKDTTFLVFLMHNGLMIYRINVIQFLLRHIKPFFSWRTTRIQQC